MNMTPSDGLFSVTFESGFAAITIGNHINRFCCCKEDEETLSHMVDVIAHSNGIYGTDMIDLERIFERCSSHRFLICPSRRLGAEVTPVAQGGSKAAILFIMGGSDMGLSDVDRIIGETVKCYPAETEILFTAENSGKIPAGFYTICVLE